MRSAYWVGLGVGLAILIGLVAWQGARSVADVLASGNWMLLVLAGFALPNLLIATASWRLLFPPGLAPRFSIALAALWMGTSVNVLLPVAGVGGEIVRARLLARWSSKVRDAVASVVVDKTVQVATLPLLALTGIAALGGTRPAPLLVALGGVALLALAIALAVLAQRAGAISFLASRAARLVRSRRWEGVVDRASDLDGAIRALYRPGRIAGSCALRFLARLSLAGEVWLAARLFGHPIPLVDAIALKSLAMVAGGVVFPVPAGLGIQEGTFVVLGALVGLPPDAALATSLATRVREIIVSVPGLIAWEYVEGRAFWRRRAA